MTRLFLAVLVGGAVCAAAVWAAGTPWAPVMGVAAVVFAVGFCWREDRAMRDLPRFERRQQRVFRCVDPEGDWIRDLRDAS